MSFSLAQRKELKETSTLTKPSPIWEGCNCLRGQAALRQSFGMARKACALRASHGLLHLSPGPSPEREGEAAHRKTEHLSNMDRTPNTDRKLVQTDNLFSVWLSPFPRGGASRDVDNQGSPEGHRLCEPYQNPDVGRLAPGGSYILPI